jgi:hypothetical protein
LLVIAVVSLILAANLSHLFFIIWEPVSTIIGWGDVRKVDIIRPSLQSPEDPDKLHIGFQAMHNPMPVYWLEVVCAEMEVIEK